MGPLADGDAGEQSSRRADRSPTAGQSNPVETQHVGVQRRADRSRVPDAISAAGTGMIVGDCTLAACLDRSSRRQPLAGQSSNRTPSRENHCCMMKPVLVGTCPPGTNSVDTLLSAERNLRYMVRNRAGGLIESDWPPMRRTGI